MAVCFSANPLSATCVRVTSPSAPNARTAASDNSLTSSPATTSFATDRPPSVCNEPSVVLVASVVSSVLRIPLNVPAAPDKVCDKVTPPPEAIELHNSIAPPSQTPLQSNAFEPQHSPLQSKP